MNETIHPDSKSDVPWSTHEARVRVPDTSMLPGSEKAPPAAVGLLNQAVQGAHDNIDRALHTARHRQCDNWASTFRPPKTRCLRRRASCASHGTSGPKACAPRCDATLWFPSLPRLRWAP